MVNMTVLSAKDIIKYLLKVTAVILVALEVTKYFGNMGKTGNIENSKIKNYSFLQCLNITIPAMVDMNKSATNKKIFEKSFKQFALNIELKMFDSLKKDLNDNGKSDENDEGITNKLAENKNDCKDKDVNEEIIKAQTGVKTEVQKTNVPNRFSTEYKGVKIRNETDYNLTEELLTPNIKINKDKILLYHTHTCESYTESEKYKYVPTGNFRTTDRDYSVVRVGRELDRQLTSYGFNVIHNETYHDYPSYTGSYSRSYSTVNGILKEEGNENIDIIVDIHRDAIGDNTYAPCVKIGDEMVAQIMFVIGGNGSNNKHDDWPQNLKFAVKIQEKANELYPGLFKPIMLRYSGYNQGLTKAAVLIEVGATGNTLEQSIGSMKYLAKVINEALK